MEEPGLELENQVYPLKNVGAGRGRGRGGREEYPLSCLRPSHEWLL